MIPISEEGRAREDCNICAIRYNREDRIPTFICRNNHTTCKKCFDALKGQRANCPFCRTPVNYGDLRVNNDIFWQLSQDFEKEKDEILRSRNDYRKKARKLGIEREKCLMEVKQSFRRQSFQNFKMQHLSSQLREQKQMKGVYKQILRQKDEEERIQREKNKKDEAILNFFRTWLLPLVNLIRQNYKILLSFCYGVFLFAQVLIGFWFIVLYKAAIETLWNKQVMFRDGQVFTIYLIFGCLELIGGWKIEQKKDKNIYQRKSEQLFSYVGNGIIFFLIWKCLKLENWGALYYQQLRIYLMIKIIDTFILVILFIGSLTQNHQNESRVQ